MNGGSDWRSAGAPPIRATKPIYGLVQTRTDRSIRERPGGAAWLARAAAQPGPRLQVPDRPPEDPYLSEMLPV
jgi:deoxyribodipyrimidine photo-lyase